MTLPLSPEELKQYNNVPTTPLTQKLGDTINDLLAGSAYQVANMAARNALTPEPNQVVRVESTGELFVWDASTPQWRVVPNSSTRPDFFVKNLTAGVVLLFCDPAGDDISGEGTQTSPFASVSRALDSIPHGFQNSVIIAVAAGTYADRDWCLSAQPGSIAPYSQGTSTTPPAVSIAGQGHLNGEAITITSANTTANLIPHPSGVGNYAAIRRFNFPTWSTSIPGPLPSMWPAVVTGAAPEYMLIREAFLAVGSSTVSVPAFSNFVVAPGSDNTTGQMHLVTTGNIFSVGNYYLANVSQLPEFPLLRGITVNTKIVFNVDACVFGYVSGANRFFPIVLDAASFSGCVFSGGGYGRINSLQSTATTLSNCYIRRHPTNDSATSVMWFSNSTRAGFSGAYIRETSLNIITGQYWNLGGVYDTSPASRPKITFGGDAISTSHGAGPSVGVSYFGAVDMIGPGIGLQLVNTSIRYSVGSGNLTFDGVTNPMTLSSHSYWGHLNATTLGTCTAPVVIGPMSMTGSAFTNTPTAAGIAGWAGLVTNTASPGQEVQVGANPVTAFASLPQTDYPLGNTSIGAVGK